MCLYLVASETSVHLALGLAKLKKLLVGHAIGVRAHKAIIVVCCCFVRVDQSSLDFFAFFVLRGLHAFLQGSDYALFVLFLHTLAAHLDDLLKHRVTISLILRRRHSTHLNRHSQLGLLISFRLPGSFLLFRHIHSRLRWQHRLSAPVFFLTEHDRAADFRLELEFVLGRARLATISSGGALQSYLVLRDEADIGLGSFLG